MKLSLVNILENVFVFIEILFKMLLFKGGVLIYAEHCIYNYTKCFLSSKSAQESRDTEDWSWTFRFAVTGMNDILKYIKMENRFNILIIFYNIIVLCIFLLNTCNQKH